MSKLLLAVTLFCMALLGQCRHHHHHHLSDDERDKHNEFDHRFRRRFNKMPTAAERFRFFDEYLLSIREKAREMETPTFRLPEPNEYLEGEVPTEQNQNVLTTAAAAAGADQTVAADNETDKQKAAETLLLDRIRKNRTTPKFACCALGQLAGNHGFHCNARFYQNRIQMRNRNRAQTRQAALEDIEREPDYNERIWQTFGNCVRKHAKSFHHCCYAARVLGPESVDPYNYEMKRV